MDIDFRNFDCITPIEDKLEEFYNTGLYNFDGSNEDKVIYILTLLSILYKEKTYSNYLARQIKSFSSGLTRDLLDEVDALDLVISEISSGLYHKDINKCIVLIYAYRDFIYENLDVYFKRKKENYIFQKIIFDVIKEQSKVKSLVQLNPFVINQVLQYEQCPLSRDERLIADVLEYYYFCLYKYPRNVIKLFKAVKKLMFINIDSHRLYDSVLFMFCDVYQELLEHDMDNKFKNVLEDKNISTTKLFKMFKDNDSFSSSIISHFVKYNIGIEEGRLDYLKSLPSYQYVYKKLKK